MPWNRNILDMREKQMRLESIRVGKIQNKMVTAQNLKDYFCTNVCRPNSFALKVREM